jgi:CRP/FNR family transcriptional regulator, cyclic AMP receptor protein
VSLRNRPSSALDALRQVPLFSRADDKELKQIAAMVREVSFPEGAAICEEGTTAVALHVIAEGTAVCRIGDREQRFGPGDLFGEVALLDGGTRTATVLAETPVKTYSIVRWDFHRLIETQPSLAVTLLETLASRLRTTDATIKQD